MEIRVLVDANKEIIDASKLDIKKHKHVSGRDFTEEEVNKFKGAKEEAKKTIKKKTLSSKEK